MQDIYDLGTINTHQIQSVSYIFEIMVQDVMAADVVGSGLELNEASQGIGMKNTAIVLYATDVGNFAAYRFFFGVDEGDGWQGGFSF